VHGLVIVGSAALGLLVGAVCNLLIDRVPDKVALRGPRDGEVTVPQSWLGVPAQPWILRFGRSPDGPLPIRWLWVELVTVAAFAELAVQHGETWGLAPLLLLVACLITVSVIDLQLQRIPDRITFPTFAASVPAIILVSVAEDTTDTIPAAFIGAAGYFFFLFVTHLVYPAGMGFGDVKLAAVMGLYLGWLGWTESLPVAGPLRLVFYALMLGCILGVVFGLGVQIATKRRGAFPFGPALAMGCYVVVLFAAELSS
jgi:leader peptidase (prepilin peptidase) / N-methyltransferase